MFLITFVYIFLCLIIFLFFLFLVGILTQTERKVFAKVQYRRGLTTTPFLSILHFFFDVLKLINKSSNNYFLRNADTLFFYFLLFFSFLIVFLLIIFFPFCSNWLLYNEFSLYLILILLSIWFFLLFFCVLFTGSTYALIALNRNIILFFCYDIIFWIFFIFLSMLSESADFLYILDFFQNENCWFNFFFIWSFIFYIFFILLIELGRAPFDMIEAEGELIAGVHIEYRGFFFSIFMLIEYLKILFFVFFFIIFFFNGFLIFFKYFFIQICFLFFCLVFILIFIILLKTNLIREKITHVINLIWKVVLTFYFFILILFSYSWFFLCNINFS